MNPYDETRYPSQVHPQTHPDRLAVAATLLGLSPAPPARCRVLDLGCGDGTNLIAMALAAPQSEFVGVDLAAETIAEGRRAVRGIGLRNVDLRAGDLCALDAGLGTFDYVVSHGVYSWVPAPVRDALLSAVRRHLRPAGVAFVSYATLPGARVRQMLRDMMLFHVRSLPGTGARTSEAASFLRFLRRGTVGEDAVAALVRAEIDETLDRAAGQLRHDDLAEVNEPVWWHEFVRHAAANDLRFLSEADWFADSDAQFPPETRAVLAGLADDPVLRSQYVDFLACRRFRQTLLVPSAARPGLRADPAVVARFRVASPIRPAAAEAAAGAAQGAVEAFVGPCDRRASTDAPVGRAALRLLGEAWPRSIPFPDLLAAASRRIASREGDGEGDRAEDADVLARLLSALHDAGIVAFHILDTPSAAVPGERPLASALARWQIRSGPEVSSIHGPAVVVEDPAARALLPLLDGTRDRAALLGALCATQVPGAPPAGPGDVERALLGLAQAGLLVS